MASVAKRRWKKPDGSTGETWIVRYKDGDAHPQKTFTLKKEAEAFKRKVEQEIEAGTHVSRRASRTVKELAAEFTTSLERREADGQISYSYVDQTRRALGYAVEEMGDLVLADLKWQRVEEFGHKLRHRKSMYGGRPFSNATINVILSAFRAAVDFGVRRGYAVKNVARDAVKEIGALPAKRIVPFSLAEMKSVIAAIEQPKTHHAPRGQALIRAAAYLGTMCGLRRGEIMGLTWNDVKFESGLLVVASSLNMRDVLKSTKTGDKGRRTIPLPAIVAEALKAWKPFVVSEPRGLIFRTRTGGIIRASDFYADL
jgi:integrase